MKRNKSLYILPILLFLASIVMRIIAIVESDEDHIFHNALGGVLCLFAVIALLADMLRGEAKLFPKCTIAMAFAYALDFLVAPLLFGSKRMLTDDEHILWHLSLIAFLALLALGTHKMKHGASGAAWLIFFLPPLATAVACGFAFAEGIRGSDEEFVILGLAFMMAACYLSMLFYPLAPMHERSSGGSQSGAMSIGKAGVASILLFALAAACILLPYILLGPRYGIGMSTNVPFFALSLLAAFALVSKLRTGKHLFFHFVAVGTLAYQLLLSLVPLFSQWIRYSASGFDMPDIFEAIGFRLLLPLLLAVVIGAVLLHDILLERGTDASSPLLSVCIASSLILVALFVYLLLNNGTSLKIFLCYNTQITSSTLSSLAFTLALASTRNIPLYESNSEPTEEEEYSYDY